MRRTAYPIVAALVLILGCGLKLEAPEPPSVGTVRAAVVAVDAALTASYSETRLLLEAGKIDASTARKVQRALDQVRFLSDRARLFLAAGKLPEAATVATEAAEKLEETRGMLGRVSGGG